MEVTSNMLTVEGSFGQNLGDDTIQLGKPVAGILIAKLRYGQELNIKCHAIKVRFPLFLSQMLFADENDMMNRDERWSMRNGHPSRPLDSNTILIIN